VACDKNSDTDLVYLRSASIEYALQAGYHRLRG
jgi:hypothetical protein